jgi:MFS family permease
VGRLPIGILAIALILFLRHESGSYAQAGGIAAAYALIGGLCAPVQGRLIDRLGQTRPLVALALANGLTLAGVVALASEHAPAAATAACAALAGATTPPVSACFRPLLIELLEGDEDLLRGGYAIDSVILEAVFITGPLLAAVLTGAFSAALAVGVGAVLAVGGSLAFAALPISRGWRGEATTTGVAGALASRGMRTLVLTALPIGVCFGTLEIALPAFGGEHGDPSIGGFLFAMLSVGSIAGGVAYGVAYRRLGSVQRAYLLLVVALPAGLALLALPGSVALMVALVTLAGCAIAPLAAAQNQLVSAVAPRGAATEGFTWLIMSTVVGVAIGNALAGALVEDGGWRAALLVACGTGALGAVVSFARRTTLAPAVRA